jgi:hypothetical protein
MNDDKKGMVGVEKIKHFARGGTILFPGLGRAIIVFGPN